MTVVTLYAFVPRYGIMGGAVATLVTYMSMAFISWLLGRKFYPVPYEVWRILTIILVATVLSGLSFLKFRGNYLASTGFMVLLVMVIFLMEGKRVAALLTGKT